MADKNKDVAARAEERRDPTVSSRVGESSVEPAPPIEEADDAAVNKEYRDMTDEEKPNPSTVAQVEIRPEERDQ